MNVQVIYFVQEMEQKTHPANPIFHGPVTPIQWGGGGGGGVGGLGEGGGLSISTRTLTLRAA